MNENKKVLTEEEKMKLSHLLAAIVPNGTLSPEDILWLMNEIENGNKNVSFDDFMKAKKERDNNKTCSTCKYYDISFNVDNIDDVVPCRSCTIHSKWAPKKSERVHLCLDCKHCACKADEEPCKSCSDYPHPGYLAMDSKWEPKETEDSYLCKDCKFVENPVFKEPCSSCFKWEDNNHYYHKNWLPKDKEEKDIKNKLSNIRKNSSSIFSILERIENKVDKLTEAIESVNSKIDILDQRMHDLRQHQILRDTKCVTQVKEANKDILEKLNNIEQVVMKNSVGINTTYEKASAVHDKVCKDEDICKDCNYYGMCSGYEGDMIYCKNFKKKDISSAKEPPKFKVGDIVKVTNDSKNNDFFVCRIKRSEHFERWNYLISMDLEDISGAFWRTEKWLTKSEDHSEPLFKVGDKVKLKHGKVVYEVYSINYFMCNKKKVYRYKIGHKATTPHYENENRLIKA